jgi:hypothetical protein
MRRPSLPTALKPFDAVVEPAPPPDELGHGLALPGHLGPLWRSPVDPDALTADIIAPAVLEGAVARHGAPTDRQFLNGLKGGSRADDVQRGPRGAMPAGPRHHRGGQRGAPEQKCRRDTSPGIRAGRRGRRPPAWATPPGG